MGKFTFAIGLVFLCFNLFSQSPGDNDPSFNPTDFGFGTGDGPNGNIHTCALQSDGKVIVGGNFTTYNGISEKCMARLNANGTLDSTFASATASNTAINSVLIQPDGKILVAGYFSISSGPVFQGIKRLNADGSTDNSFTGSIGMYSFIKTMVLQPDGKIIIAGNFTTYNGISRNYISRLNTDGSLDMSFSIGSGLDNAIVAMVMQPDGKIVIGGYFTSYNGTTVNRIARLNADGTLDGTFNTGTGLNSIVTAIGVQPDGKILVTGSFNSYNGASTGGLIRLDINGILDGTFTPIAGDIESISVQLDGKIIITGNFTGLNGVNKNRIGRLNTNGTTDATFNVGTGTDQQINSTILQSDGKVIIAGNFSAYNSLVRNKITRLNLNGSVDLTFVGVTGANNSVNAIVLESTGNIAIGGNFTSVNGVNKNHLARFNASGAFAPNYPSGSGTNGNVYAMGTQQSTDKTVLAGGNFYEYNGVSPYCNLIGIDPIFGNLNSPWLVPWGWTASNVIYSMAVHSDGKIVFGGNFFNYVGTNSYNIVRCYYDGTVDQPFVANASANSTVRAVALQGAKIIAGGDFTICSGVSRNRITRLNNDGTSDPTFTVGLGADNTINAIAVQPDGKILIGGIFTSYNGISRNGIARLNADGTLDITFTPGSGTNNTIKAITLQSDGKILIGGNFTNYNGIARNCLARLNADGTLDNSFLVGSGTNGMINTIAISASNNILIGGDFTSYNGAGRNRIAQIYSCITPTIANTTPAAALAICNGSNTKLTASSLGAISWYSSATSTVALSVGNSYITPTLSTGTYTYYAEATSCMNASTRLAIVVTVSSLTAPVITVNSGSVCPSTAFVMTPSGGITYTYASGSATVNPSVTSYYYVTGKSANGCTNVVTSTVVVHPRPLITVNSGSICSGSSFTIIPSGANTYTYTGGSAIVSPTTNTTYNVTGTSTLGCVSASAAMSNVMVGAAPLMSVSNGTICTGNSFTISPSGAASYTYSSGSAVVTPTSNSTYTVTSNSYFNGCSSTKTVLVYVATPTISVNSSTICSGQSFTITASGANIYTWNTGANTSSIVVTPSTNTIYTVTGTNINGCVNTGTASVTVSSEPTFTLSSLSETITCLNQVVGFSINTTDSFVWSGPGVISPSTTSASVTVNTPGIYTVSVNNGSCSETDTVSVSSNTLSPNVNITPVVPSICYGDNVMLIGGTSYTNAVTYLWSNGIPVVYTQVSPTLTTVYTLTITDVATGCYGSNSYTLVVHPLPSLTITATNTVVCAGSSTTLEAQGASNYTWSNGYVTPIAIVLPNTTKTYTVTGVSTIGCENTETITVTVDNSCADVWPGDANSDGVANNLDVLELGLHYTQTGMPRVGVSNSWQAYFADNWTGTITNGKNLNHSDCNGDGIINDDDTLAIYTNYGLTHAFKPTQSNVVNPQLSIVPDQAMVLKGNWGTASVYLGDATSPINTINGIAYTVDFDNSLIEPNSIYIEYQNSFIDVGQNLHFQKTGFANGKVYTASTHTISNNASGFGKIATLHYQIKSNLATDDVLTIGISQANQSDANGMITSLSSGTGTLMAVAATVSVKEILMNGNVLISPNPTNGILNISFSIAPQNNRIEVYNSIGALVLTERMNNKNNTINMSEFSSGIYFMKVLEGNNVITVKKVVRE